MLARSELTKHTRVLQQCRPTKQCIEWKSLWSVRRSFFFFTRKQRQYLVAECRCFNNCHTTIHRSISRQMEGEDNHLALWPPPADNKAIMNHPGYMVVILNINVKLHTLRLKATTAEIIWLLCVYIIQKLWELVQMYPTIYIQVGHGTHISKSVPFHQNRDMWDH
jgi:hypothetical protein